MGKRVGLDILRVGGVRAQRPGALQEVGETFERLGLGPDGLGGNPGDNIVRRAGVR